MSREKEVRFSLEPIENKSFEKTLQEKAKGCELSSDYIITHLKDIEVPHAGTIAELDYLKTYESSWFASNEEEVIDKNNIEIKYFDGKKIIVPIKTLLNLDIVAYTALFQYSHDPIEDVLKENFKSNQSRLISQITGSVTAEGAVAKTRMEKRAQSLFRRKLSRMFAKNLDLTELKLLQLCTELNEKVSDNESVLKASNQPTVRGLSPDESLIQLYAIRELNLWADQQKFSEDKRGESISNAKESFSQYLFALDELFAIVEAAVREVTPGMRQEMQQETALLDTEGTFHFKKGTSTFEEALETLGYNTQEPIKAITEYFKNSFGSTIPNYGMTTTEFGTRTPLNKLYVFKGGLESVEWKTNSSSSSDTTTFTFHFFPQQAPLVITAKTLLKLDTRVIRAIFACTDSQERIAEYIENLDKHPKIETGFTPKKADLIAKIAKEMEHNGKISAFAPYKMDSYAKSVFSQKLADMFASAKLSDDDMDTLIEKLNQCEAELANKEKAGEGYNYFRCLSEEPTERALSFDEMEVISKVLEKKLVDLGDTNDRKEIRGTIEEAYRQCLFAQDQILEDIQGMVNEIVKTKHQARGFAPPRGVIEAAGAGAGAAGAAEAAPPPPASVRGGWGAVGGVK